MSNLLRVLVVESDEVSSRELLEILTTVEDIELLGEAKDRANALAILGSRSVDIAIFNIGANDSEAISLIKQIRKEQSHVRILVVTKSNSAEDIFTALDAGADGYVLKRNLSEVLDKAIRSVTLDMVFLDPGIAAQVLVAIESATTERDTRTLPTGLIVIPLFNDEKDQLRAVAESKCEGGVCMVEPSFLKKLRRYAPTTV